MTLSRLLLARCRLWLGIINVGFWVLTAAAGLYWLSNGDTSRFDVGHLFVALAAVVIAQAVFDAIGGAVLTNAPRLTWIRHFGLWARGVFVHTLLLIGVGGMSYLSLRLTGGFGAAILLATVGLALGRRHLLRAVADVRTEEIRSQAGTILIASATDPAFTGGIVGFGSRARSVLPAIWLDTVPQDELAAESSRRRWQMNSGLPFRAFILILIWNLFGGFAGSIAFNLAERKPVEALFGYAAWMTLWAFFGLLVLPVLSRSAVFASDSAAAGSACDPAFWIARFSRLVSEDGSSSPAVQTIFYPIPSVALRLGKLKQPFSGFVLGNLARNNLYFSWATLTLLGRAVHCNVGRPELWVFPPSA